MESSNVLKVVRKSDGKEIEVYRSLRTNTWIDSVDLQIKYNQDELIFKASYSDIEDSRYNYDGT